MIMRVKWLLGVLVASLLLAGCSSSSLDTPTGGDSGVAPPIHVNLTRAGTSYSPAQVRHAYGFDTISGTGAGQTIAIVDVAGSPTIQSDLNTFCSRFGLPPTTVAIAYPTGKPSRTDSGWALETSLDVEWAHAIAPGARILLVVARTSYFSDLLAAVDYAAQNAAQVSMSWGGSEASGMSAYDTHFNKPGVTFVASSGDSGAGVEWPAVSPYVVGVGGTTLNLDSSGNRLAETAWAGSGGGQSRYFTEPAFQTTWQSSHARQVPDVSYDADPNTGFLVYDSTAYSGYRGWFVVGGTSAGAPQWAALMALVNAGRASRLAGANTALYSFGSPTVLTQNYTDITSGSNGGYQTKVGYDMVTGLGTPKAGVLTPKLTTY